MEKINKLREKREVTPYKVVHNIKGALYLGLALSPVIGIAAGCASNAQESQENKTEIVIESNYCAVIIEDGSAVIIDYTMNPGAQKIGWYGNFVELELTTGGTFQYLKTDKTSIVFFKDIKAHELAVLYAESIVGDNYTEYNKEVVEKVRK